MGTKKRRNTGDALPENQPDNEIAENRVMAALKKILGMGEEQVNEFDEIHREAGIDPNEGVTDEEKATFNQVMDAIQAFSPRAAGTGPGAMDNESNPVPTGKTYPKTPGQDEVTDPDNPELNGDQHWEDCPQPKAPDVTHGKPPVTGTALDARSVARNVMQSINAKNHALLEVEGLVGSTAKLNLVCDSARDVYAEALKAYGITPDANANLAGLRMTVSTLQKQRQGGRTAQNIVGDSRPADAVEMDLVKKMRERLSPPSYYM